MYNWNLYYFPRAAIIKYHALFWRVEFKVRVPGSLVSLKASLLSLQMVISMLCPHRAMLLLVHIPSLSSKGNSHIGLGYPPYGLSYPLEALSPVAVILRIKAPLQENYSVHNGDYEFYHEDFSFISCSIWNLRQPEVLSTRISHCFSVTSEKWHADCSLIRGWKLSSTVVPDRILIAGSH